MREVTRKWWGERQKIARQMSQGERKKKMGGCEEMLMKFVTEHEGAKEIEGMRAEE